MDDLVERLRKRAEIQLRLTWPQVTDQPEIGSEGSHQ